MTRPWFVAFVFAFVFSSVAAAQSKYETDVRFAVDEIGKRAAALIAIKNIDWPKAAAPILWAAKKTKTDEEHLVLLARLLARLRDGHAVVKPSAKGKDVRWPTDPKGEKTGPGFFLCRVEKAIYVKNAWGGARAAGLRAGDEVKRIDGKPAAEWLASREAECRELFSFSTDQQSFFYTCHWGLADYVGTERVLEIVGTTGKADKKTVRYTKAQTTAFGPAFPPKDLVGTDDLGYAKTASGNAYVHVRRSPENLPALLDQALEKIGDAKGMILDLRGNSGGGFDHDALMGRFVPKGKTIAFGSKYAGAGERPFTGPVVVIIDATVRSAGETLAGIFKEDGRAYVIGESPTAGMSSQKTTLELPSGLFALYFSVSSNKQRMNGGKGLEGIGVSPHLRLAYDPKDLAAERDTFIERAEALLRRFPQKDVPYDPAKF